MLRKFWLLIILPLLLSSGLQAQVQEKANPVLVGSAKPEQAEALSLREIIPPKGEHKIYNPKNRRFNKVVPGKGYPKTVDAALQEKEGKIASKSPILTFDAVNTSSTPTDPTGAVGPNHYVNAWNSAFSIFDKEGTLLLPPTSLESLGGTFVGEDMGDPIVLYDSFADRFLITQFSGCTEPSCFDKVHETNSLLVAISKGPDPVNDGWYTYRFKTGTFPDYPKWYVWSDGYYVTTNQDPTDPNYEEVVYVLERDQMIIGEEAQHVGLPLPGARINGFYSPSAFNAIGDVPPPRGNAPILFFQDDAWQGVNIDHLKLWLVNVDWDNPQNSTIEESQVLGPSEGVTPFHSTFDGGSFENLSQPEDAADIDALQGAVMYPTTYRRFPTHNSVVFNFVVDVDATQLEHAGIRWYELRQDAEGGPWSVYQEGTYAPDSNDRWCGSISIDHKGNIGLGFTIMNDDPKSPIFPSLRYTGRYATDTPGLMTLKEQTIAESPVPDPSFRYGDYSHISLDPVDEETFWFKGEYFIAGSRMNKVGVFRIAPEFQNDVGIVDVVSPKSSSLGSSENVTVLIRNYGIMPQSNFSITLEIEDGPTITETFSGTINSTEEKEFTFSETVNLSESGRAYSVAVETGLQTDEDRSNDRYEEMIENLYPKDVGVTVIHSPETGENLGLEDVVVNVENLGGETQSNFPVGYSLDDGELVMETFSQVIVPQEEVAFTFSNPVDLSDFRRYVIAAATFLEGDSDRENDETVKTVANLDCIPIGSDCGLGDGVQDFYFLDIINENIYCTRGYADFIGNYSTIVDRSQGTITVGASTGFAGNELSLWIDFNDNAVFEEGERLITSARLPSAGRVFYFEFEIPEDAPLGEHIMRVRAGDPSEDGDVNDPCNVMAYGTTHDYVVVVVSSIEESVLKDAEFLISSEDGNIFDLNLVTDYQSFLWVTVHDMLGQKLVQNRIDKSFGSYSYQLDMSYTATGVYLVRIGTREEGKVQRIIVR